MRSAAAAIDVIRIAQEPTAASERKVDCEAERSDRYNCLGRALAILTDDCSDPETGIAGMMRQYRAAAADGRVIKMLFLTTAATWVRMKGTS